MGSSAVAVVLQLAIFRTRVPLETKLALQSGAREVRNADFLLRVRVYPLLVLCELSLVLLFGNLVVVLRRLRQRSPAVYGAVSNKPLSRRASAPCTWTIRRTGGPALPL